MGLDWGSKGGLSVVRLFMRYLRARTLLATVFKAFVAMLLFVILLVPLITASAQTGLSNSINGLYYTGLGGNASTLYQDAIGPNPDVGIRLCGHGARYVGGYYALNVSGTFLQALVTYSSSSQALALTDTPTGGGCYEVTPGYLTISPSYLITPSPAVYKAAFPGQLWTGYSVSSNPGNLTTFEVGQNDSYLRGNYSVVSSLDTVNNTITIDEPNVTFETSIFNFTKPASDSLFGINTQRPMIIGFCDDADGTSCSDGRLLTSPSFPLTLNAGLGPGQANDQQTLTKYVVINGIGQQVCVGANLQIAIANITPQTSYFGQTVTIATVVTNTRGNGTESMGGNVAVTTPFSVNVAIANASNASQQVYTQSLPAAVPLQPGQSEEVDFALPANFRGGEYTATAIADVGDFIVECNETDNAAAANLSVIAVANATILIDNVRTSFFSQPNLPYTLNITLNSSDQGPLINTTVRVTQQNGINLNVGTQLFNVTYNASLKMHSGVISTSQASTLTNNLGQAVFTYIPTYNSMYDPQYSYLDLPGYIGTSSVYIEAYLSNGTQLMFLVGGVPVSQYPLTVGTQTTSVVQKSVQNNLTMLQSLDDSYRTFVNFIQSIS